MDHHDDAVRRAEERFAKIRKNPELAVFGQFRGVSPSGAVTVWVDLMGRLARLHIAPSTAHDGCEEWLTEEILAAHREANRAADLIDFNLADLALELDAALTLGQRVRQDRPAAVEGARPATDDGFDQQTVLH